MNKTSHKTQIGPVQLIAIGFKPGAKFEGKIMHELEVLDRMKTIRILDLLFVMKDKETKDLIALSIQEEKLGAIIGALMGFEFKEKEKKVKKGEINDDDNNAFGLTTKEIEDIGESLAPGMAAGVLLIEHVWAKQLKEAIRGAGGVPIAEGFLTPEALTDVMGQLKDISKAMDDMEKERTLQQNGARVYN